MSADYSQMNDSKFGDNDYKNKGYMDDMDDDQYDQPTKYKENGANLNIFKDIKKNHIKDIKKKPKKDGEGKAEK